MTNRNKKVTQENIFEGVLVEKKANRLVAENEEIENEIFHIVENSNFKKTKINFSKKEIIFEKKIKEEELKKGDNLVIFFNFQQGKKNISLIKKIIAEKNDCSTDDYFSEIKIYPDSLSQYANNPEALIKKMDNSILNFYFLDEDIGNPRIGKKIENLIESIDDKKGKINIRPVPPCLYESGYPEIIKRATRKDNRVFLPTFKLENTVKYYPQNIKEDEGIVLLEKCNSCNLRKEKECRGVYRRREHGFVPDKVIIPRIEEILSDPLNFRLLDCGCGFKPDFLNFYKKISNEGAEIYLLDPNEEEMNAAKKAIEDCNNISAVVEKVEEINFSDNFFDVITMVSVYHHIFDIDSAFENIKKWLKDEGVLIISDRKEYPGKNNITGKDLFLHHRNHNLDEAVVAIEKKGFKIMDKNSNEEKSNWVIEAIKK